jgi:hypothetical protein
VAAAVSRRRGQVRRTRSSHEEYGRIVYYCTGGAGTVAWPAPAGLTWLPGGGHAGVAAESGPGPALLRCPVCGLTKPVNYKARRRIAAAGLAEVDISALPF